MFVWGPTICPRRLVHFELAIHWMKMDFLDLQCKWDSQWLPPLQRRKDTNMKGVTTLLRGGGELPREFCGLVQRPHCPPPSEYALSASIFILSWIHSFVLCSKVSDPGPEPSLKKKSDLDPICIFKKSDPDLGWEKVGSGSGLNIQIENPSRIMLE